MKIAVIGAGASGMMAAIQAAGKGAEVTCFERKEKIGKKIYATGNGHCNFSNQKMLDPTFQIKDGFYTKEPSKVEQALQRIGVRKICTFFEQEGMLIRSREGYLYPYSGQAGTVVELLTRKLKQVNATIFCDVQVLAVKKRPDGRFQLVFQPGENCDKKNLRNHTLFDRVILAGGGKAAPALGSDGSGFTLAAGLGHHVTGCRPSLCGVKCEGIFFSEWAGIRTAATVRVLSQDRKEILTENTGEVQLTDYGISGIPTFQVSHVIGEHLNSLHNTESVKENGVPLELDFLPDFTEEYLQQQLQTRLRNTVTESLTLANLFMGMVNSKLLACILKQKGLQWEQRISFPDATALLQTLKHFPVNATGLNDFTQAQVTAGGVPLEEIDQNFQSLKVPGLFLCGELLDVDGICGGYNLQWAWTSGWIAGESASTF
mgnify:FL=1